MRVSFNILNVYTHCGGQYSWISVEPTPTPTLGMRLSCNFVNVYSTRVHVYTRASLTRILARKIARVGHSSQLNRKLRTQVYTPLCPRLISSCVFGGSRRAKPNVEDARAEVGEDVHVGVGVGPMELELYVHVHVSCNETFLTFLFILITFLMLLTFYFIF